MENINKPRVPLILVVDDDPTTLTATAGALVSCGYAVETCRSGKAGLQKAEELLPNVVLLDVDMPVVDGFEVCRRLRANSRTAGLPVMMLSSKESVEDKVRGLDAGADEFVKQPIQAVELDARIKVLLRHSIAEATRAYPKAASGRVVAVYSLRGGVGISTIATNLAASFAQIWATKSVLADLVLTAGLDSFLLNLVPAATWVDLARIAPEEMDEQLLGDVLLAHSSNVMLLAAPLSSQNSISLMAEHVSRVLTLLKQKYQYVVVDLPHDTEPTTHAALKLADDILLVVAPDLASVATAKTALDNLQDMNITTKKIHILLNHTLPGNLVHEKFVQRAIDLDVKFSIPYAKEAVDAINTGAPMVLQHSVGAAGEAIEMVALNLSSPQHREQGVPQSKAWQRVTRNARTNNNKGFLHIFS